jgi:hypothetical protein
MPSVVRTFGEKLPILGAVLSRLERPYIREREREIPATLLHIIIKHCKVVGWIVAFQTQSAHEKGGGIYIQIIVDPSVS